MFMISAGIQQAAGANIGQQIGNGNIVKAKQYFEASIVIALVMITLCVLLFYIFGKYIILMFTTNQDIVTKCMEVIVLVTFCMLPDMWQGYMQGPIKALGLQAKVIPINLVAYWLINIPLSCLFSFTF